MKKISIAITLFVLVFAGQSFASSFSFNYDTEENRILVIVYGLNWDNIPEIVLSDGSTGIAATFSNIPSDSVREESEAVIVRVINSPEGYALRCRETTNTSNLNNVVIRLTNGSTAERIDVVNSGDLEWWMLINIVDSNGEEVEGPCFAASGNASERWLEQVEN